MTSKIRLRVSKRGPRGAMEPEDRVRVDAAIETAETINARIGEATEAAEIATEAAAATDADAQATEAGRQQALQAAGDAAAARQAAEQARLLAEQERQAAEAAAVAAALRAGYYDTIAAGRAAVADGESFAVRAGGPDGLARPTIYRRDSATTQTPVVTIVNPSEVDAGLAAHNARITKIAGDISGLHNTAAEQPFELTDASGNVFFRINHEFVSEFFGGLLLDGRENPQPFEITDDAGNVVHRINGEFVSEFYGGSQFDGREHTWPFAITDADGNVIGGYRDNRWHFPGLEIDSSLDRLDQRNRDRSITIMSTPRLGLQMPVTGASIINGIGQSLSKGQETWPSLSKTPVPGALMMGDNADPTTNRDSYGVIGALQFNPLVANTRSGATNLTGAQEAALAPGSANFGEIPVIGTVNALKRWLNRRDFSVNDGRNLIALSSGVSGTTIEQLSKVPSDGINRYGIVTDGLQKAVGLAPEATVPVLSFAQGEYNYPTLHGGDTTRVGYRTKLATYFDDIVSDIFALVPQQEYPPLIVSYQTSAGYTVDLDATGQPGLAIGMAQLDLALSDPRIVMFGPSYPYTDKGGHLDSNGSRWMGHHVARAVQEVWSGRNFQPTRPMEIVAEGAEIFLHYHVPVPPLVFDMPYQVSAPADFSAKGYRVTAANGSSALTIQSVEIVRPTIVKLTLTATPPADALVWYAAKAVTNGNGCVRDSDPSVATDNYEYVPERGMYAAANIPALIDRPYPLWNWSVAFCLPLGYSEF